MNTAINGSIPDLKSLGTDRTRLSEDMEIAQLKGKEIAAFQNIAERVGIGNLWNLSSHEETTLQNI